MGPRVDAVDSSEQWCEQADVVVIGGGIAGTCTALSLAQRGVSVVLCEKGVVAGEQSSRNWGWCRTMGRDEREIPLSIESLRRWRDIDRLVEGETGFCTSGIAYACEDDKQVASHESWLEIARQYGVDTRMLNAEETAKLLPGASRSFKGALYTPSDGRAEPQKAAPAIARAVQRLGGHVYAECAVRGVERMGGRISGVVTERGSIRCSSVVVAGGAWSRLFCGNLGVALPQLTVRSTALRTSPVTEAPLCSAATDGYAFRKRLDGGYTVASGFETMADITPDTFRLFFDFLPALRQEWPALKIRFGSRFFEELRRPRRWSLSETTPFEKTRVLDPLPPRKINARALDALVAEFPAFASARVLQEWAGIIDVTPDAVPVISAVDDQPGLYVATGFSGHGFGFGPGVGELMADLVTGDAPIVDPSPYRLSRYSDGSRPKPMEGL
ncbi:NAD(P)/FAD-dependent oxidoreductase [Modicisalibacter radicis]|uniref:NAD(P)/FAD-dependent oxidoreductase n=1 Tax=Halomonas sp. EAR18 TaxID=2518972 RepID=UPI00109C18C3|nr:FAD-binding oxidoreductase [Halomonas sp. EAR18]